jgi:hypothetical protein
MNPAEKKSTRNYRNRLLRSLAVAKLRLSPIDFASFAPGIQAEIRRLDEELITSALTQASQGYAGRVHFNCVHGALLHMQNRMTLGPIGSVSYNNILPSAVWSNVVQFHPPHHYSPSESTDVFTASVSPSFFVNSCELGNGIHQNRLSRSISLSELV